jgi:hypothetical protein
MFYFARRSAMKAAVEREGELDKVYEAAKPPPPEAIRFNPKDELLRGPKEWEHRGDDEHYTFKDIRFLRNKKRTKIVLIEGKRCEFRDERVVDDEAQKRAEIVIAAFDAWDAECDRIEEETGSKEAERVADALCAEVDTLANKIWETPAHTLGGLAIKASAIQDLYYEPSERESVIRGLCQEIAAVADYPVAASSSNASDAEQAAA